ncbi:hypothetical protein BASA81_003050 [Batrachochytrium salamandrivorans]|nr:hypothetical protein BASA81_003050 [Batrachochytrium salamandrivorans]
MSEAHLLFTATVLLAAFLVFRVLEAGLLGSLSVRYALFFNRENKELKRLQLSQDAEKATLFLKSPVFSTEEAKKFTEVMSAVPVDEATDEAILHGKEYEGWIFRMKLQLAKRAGETLYAYRNNEYYFRDTFCKMTQGLATMRAWKEAQEKQESFNGEFQDIAMWASRLQPGWERTIFQDRAREVDEQMRREKMALIQDQKKAQEEYERRMREKKQ